MYCRPCFYFSLVLISLEGSELHNDASSTRMRDFLVVARSPGASVRPLSARHDIGDCLQSAPSNGSRDGVDDGSGGSASQ